MKRKWRSEKDARKIFTQENNLKFKSLLLNKARVLRSERLGIGIAEDKSNMFSLSEQV